MIAQFDLFTGEPAPIILGKNERSAIARKPENLNTIETDRYRYRIEGRNLIVIDKRSKQCHEHNLRGLITTHRPLQTFVFRMHKLEKAQNKRFYCLGAFLLDFMNSDQLLKECQAFRNKP